MNKVQLPSSLKGKNVFIAGVAGFVPSHVAEKYLQLEASVYGADNFITGTQANLIPLQQDKNFHFEEQDIVKGIPSFGGVKFDYVFNLASPASPLDFKKIPLEIIEVNSIGTRHLLEVAKEHGARFLEASTSEVYGDPEVHPQVETYKGSVSTLGPRAPYDVSKRFAEMLTMTYHRLYGLDSRIVRIFNTYGPRMRPNDGRVIPNFINQALRGEELTVYGDGSQTRSFCYVDDLVEAIHHVMFCSDHTPFNIGNPDEYSIADAAKFIIQALGSSSKISYHPLPEDDPKQRRPDLSKLQAVSDYTPKISFEEGLKRTAEYFKNQT